MAGLRQAVRLLARQPALSATIVATLALAVGASTAIYTVVRAVLLAPLPVFEPDRVVFVWETSPRPEDTMRIASTHNVASWRAASRHIDEFGVWRDWGFRLETREGPQPLAGLIGSAGLFRVLRTTPLHGRVFTEDDEAPGRNTVVLLSHACWRDRFGGDPSLVGRTITLTRSPEGRRPFTVIGILPPDALPSMAGAEFWAPATLDPDLRQDRWLRNRRVLARLAPGATLETARAELSGIAAALGREFPASNAGWGVGVAPLADVEIGEFRKPLAIFSGAIFLLLVIACANVAGLLLARASGRTREIGIRLALGSRRSRIVRMLLAESFVLSLPAALFGALTAAWLLALFKSYGPPLPRSAGIAIDGDALIFTVVVSLAVGLLFGLAPALQSASIVPADSLKEGSRSFLRIPGVRFRAALVTTEIALSLMLLVAAALAMRSFLSVLRTDIGVEATNLTVFQVFPPSGRYPDPERKLAVYREIDRRLRGVAGVTSVGAVSAGPLFGGMETIEFSIEGQPPPAPGSEPRARFFDASPGYLTTMGLQMIQGRWLSDQDQVGSPWVAVVNETFARRNFPEGAVGRRIRLQHDDRGILEIVGVVSDVRTELAPGAPPEAQIYWPAAQYVRGAIYFIVRSSIPPASVAPGIRAALLELDRDLVPSRLNTMDAMIERAVRRPRFDGLLLTAFAAFAMLLAAVGIYGLVSHAAASRTREIGIRISLGANPRDVLNLVLAQGMRIAVAGVGLGLAGSLALAMAFPSFGTSRSRTDLAAFAAASAVLLLVTLVACLVPARRAARVDPILALRAE